MAFKGMLRGVPFSYAARNGVLSTVRVATYSPRTASLLMGVVLTPEVMFYMNSPRKILLIDNAPDRKERIKALSVRGYAVFPALKMEEARSRCTRGGYDLIVVHAGEQQEQALAFCDELHSQCPKQALLLSSSAVGERDYAVPDDLSSLLQRVDQMLHANQQADLASAA